MPGHFLYSAAMLREIEQTALSALPAGTLMQRAGAAAATLALQLVQVAPTDATILVLAGPGNNGGDALDCAAHLADAGARVHIVLLAAPERLPTDASAALQRVRASTAVLSDHLPGGPWSLVVDGLFGIGLQRALEGSARALVEAVNLLGCPVLALDVPSGLDADTGNVVGENGIALRASHTITFIGDKPGLHTADGRDYSGVVSVAELGLDMQQFAASPIQLGDVDLFRSAARRRLQNSHKGSYGDVSVIGGAQGMTGAVLLAARSALYSGAGRVFAAFVGPALALDPQHPELMCRMAEEVDFAQSVLVIGPGMGTALPAKKVLMRALQSDAPLVLDADALNLIAAEPGLKKNLAGHRSAVLLTPHPLEAARLLACSTAAVQSDRLRAASDLAQQCNAVVILKGSGSVIAAPDGALVINPTGNPALATGGAGDVLAGVCGALLAQGWPVWQAAVGAVWMHGRAADILVQQGVGPIGLCASELPAQLRREINRLAN